MPDNEVWIRPAPDFSLLYSGFQMVYLSDTIIQIICNTDGFLFSLFYNFELNSRGSLLSYFKTNKYL